MEQKINIAELLKNCPRGMELDCTMYDDITLVGVDDMENTIFPIRLLRKDGTSVELTKYGQYADADYAKCVIFPKGKTTWEGFQRPFMDGDIVATTDGRLIGITAGGKSGKFMPTYCVITGCGEFEVYLNKKETWQFHRLATEEEKEKLFQAIKENGYVWNAETKTLKTLTPNKFDINTLKPFDKVLVRDNNEQFWTCDWFSFHDTKQVYPFACVGHYVSQCIPYEGNQHLLGTTNDCDEFYKNWE